MSFESDVDAVIDWDLEKMFQHLEEVRVKHGVDVDHMVLTINKWSPELGDWYFDWHESGGDE